MTIVDERHIVPDEHVVLDAHARAHERVALNADAATDGHLALDLNECTDAALIADLTAVQIDEFEDGDVPTKLHIVGDIDEPSARDLDHVVDDALYSNVRPH